MNFLQQILNKIRGTEGVVLFEDDARNSAIKELQKRTRLKVVKK